MKREKYVQIHKQTSINIVNTEVESIRNKDIVRIGYRVYKDGYIGIAGAIGEPSDEELEEEAIKNLSLKIPYTYELTQNMHIEENCIEDETDKLQVLKEVEEMMEELRRDYPDFCLSNKINIEEVEHHLTNDEQLDLISRDRSFVISVLAREQSSINIFDTGVGGSWRTWDKKAMLQEITNHLTAYRKVVALPEGDKLPIILQGSETELLLSKLATELNGHKMGTKASLFTTFIGEKKFDEGFSLYQDGTKESFMRMFDHRPFFDMEGVVNDKGMYPLIEQGKIVAAYTDKKTAETFNMPLTGAASAAYDGVPSLEVPALTIASSGKTLKELLDGKIGVILIIASGGDYTPDGNFATPVQVAMLTDGEKLLGRVPEFELSGHMYEIFGEDFVGCSKDRPFSGMNGLVVNMKVKR